MRFSIRLIFFTSHFGKEIGKQPQSLSEAADADAQVVDFVRAGLFGGAVDLKRQRGEQVIHLLDGIIVNGALVFKISPASR